MYIGQNKWNLWLGGSGEHVTLLLCCSLEKYWPFPRCQGSRPWLAIKRYVVSSVSKNSVIICLNLFTKNHPHSQKGLRPKRWSEKCSKKWQHWHSASISARFRSWQELSNLDFVWRLGERTWTKIRVDDACQTKKTGKMCLHFRGTACGFQVSLGNIFQPELPGASSLGISINYSWSKSS